MTDERPDPTDRPASLRGRPERGVRPERSTAVDAPVDPSVFPDLAARRAADGERRARWDAALADPAPFLADGGMGTMLFAAGLEFGDPPETWTVTHPDAVRAIHRGYLEAGSRIVLTNTFGANRVRMALHGNEGRVDELNRAAAALLRDEVRAAGGTALVAGDIGPSGAIMAPIGPLAEGEATDVFAEQAAALVAGGVDVIWIETMSDLAEIRAAIAGVRRVAPGIPLIATMTFDTRGRTMMGVTPEHAVQHPCRPGGRRDRRQLRERPRRAPPGHRRDASRRFRCGPGRQAERRDPPDRGRPRRLRGHARVDGRAGDPLPRRRGHDHRGVLREHAGPPRRDVGRARRGSAWRLTRRASSISRPCPTTSSSTRSTTTCTTASPTRS